MNKSIKITFTSMPPLEEYVEEIKSIWETHWLTNVGEKHHALEKELARFLEVKNLSLFVNGHSALETAISVFDLHGEVITTPYTFASTTHAIVRNGLAPVFCDINPSDFTIDTEKLESLITENTSAILPVHVYGNVCNFQKIEWIAGKYNLKVIYDAAHAFGETVDKTAIGNFGDASVFSFHATKVFNTIEGGAIAYSDDSLKYKMESLRNFGIGTNGSVDFIGSNLKMNEFQAAMGLCNLRHFEEAREKRKAVAKRYAERLDGVKGILLNKTKENVKSNYTYFPVVFDGFSRSLDEVMTRLKAENIFARRYFWPLTSRFACYRGRFDMDNTPSAGYISERVLSLPLYPDLPMSDVDRICKIILQ